MEIILGTIKDKSPKEGREIRLGKRISKKEYVAIQTAVKEIHDFKANQCLIEIFLRNNEEIQSLFSDSFRELLSKSVVWPSIKENDLEEIFLQASRLLLNYLSSFRTYLDHSETVLKRKYGVTSRQVKRFKDLLAFNFDNNFSYRFFYKLRNYAQHCGVPLSNVSFKAEHDRENNEIHGRLAAYFDPVKLVNDFDGWGAKVKADLLLNPEPIELRGLRESTTSIVYNIFINVQKINASKSIKAARYLLKKTQHLEQDGTEVCIFYDLRLNSEGHLTSISNFPIPLKDIKKVLELDQHRRE